MYQGDPRSTTSRAKRFDTRTGTCTRGDASRRCRGGGEVRVRETEVECDCIAEIERKN